ncbi:hypothetical protein MTBPR1_160032 [Candidatus Terasakiella magnetica]|uniref:Uncharacterized protein n=1 Tax=Candidatus Terasakiella magnetica TaxID=1867952 RepID=A0A1C3RFL0_9PROT|nr:hypothetical protein [Candidatus Terasakiella magnetica]SCA56041.1 hypothetical protein MTBPR1_160032 [Candidatus Terasakiella magnetica]
MYVAEKSEQERLLKWNYSNEDFDEVSVPSGVKPTWVGVLKDGRPWFISSDSKIYRAK